MQEIALAKKILAALGISPDSPLFGAESWITWSVAIVFTAVGYSLADPYLQSYRLLLGFVVLASAITLSLLTAFVFPMRSHGNDELDVKLGGFWLTSRARDLHRQGLSISQILDRANRVSAEVFPPLSIGTARALSTLGIASLCFSLAGLLALGGRLSLETGARSFVAVAEKHGVQASRVLTQDGQLPRDLESARLAFEAAWRSSSPLARTQLDQQIIYNALYKLTELYRSLEINHMLKPKSLFWADEQIRHFQQIEQSSFLADAYCNKVAVILDMTQLYHRNPLRYAKQGSTLLARALDVRGDLEPKRRSRILRLWSRILYDLARPVSGNLSERWDNEYLEQAFRKAEAAYSAYEDDQRNLNQWARTSNRIIRNNWDGRHLLDEWLGRIARVRTLLETKWRKTKSEPVSVRDRLAPLNNLANLTLDLVAVEWIYSHQKHRGVKAREFMKTILSVAIPAQIEFRQLLVETEVRESYSFDVSYDLSRMYALLTQLSSAVEPERTRSYFEEAIRHFNSAIRAATFQQRQGARQGLLDDPSFRGLDKSLMEALERLL